MPHRTLLAVCSFTLVLAACAEGTRAIRSVSEPPGFSQIETADIRTAMHVMAANAHALDAALRAEQTDEALRQQQVIGALDGMFAAASNIQPSGETTDHPMLDKRLPMFLSDVQAARRAAASTPPSYFLAGSVAGSCAACHRETQR
jgi:hypothetical protein